MTTGLEGIAAGASALAGQAAGLRAAVDSGKVVMTPDAAERVAKIYEDRAEKVVDLVSDAQRLIRRGVYGDCYIGRGLEQKFTEKVQGSAAAQDAGLVPILRKTEQILRDMAQAYRDAARDTTNTDEEHARNLSRNV